MSIILLYHYINMGGAFMGEFEIGGLWAEDIESLKKEIVKDGGEILEVGTIDGHHYYIRYRE